MEKGELNPLVNNTKWEELRLAMYSLGENSPRWRSKDLSGHTTTWDRDWFYHFRDGGYSSMEWVEIEVISPDNDGAVLGLMREIQLPGHRIPDGYRIYGYIANGTAIDYL